MPPVINWLISAYGWRNSYIIVGVVVLTSVIIASQFLKRDPAKMGQRPYGENEAPERELNLSAEGLSLGEATHTVQFWMAVTMLFCFGLASMTITVHIVPHAIDLGISATVAANILAARGAAILTSCVAIGGIADRIGNRQAFVICFVLMSTALFWLLTIKEAWMLYLFAFIMGFGGGGGATLESPLAAELFGVKSHGLVLGIFSFCYTIGAATGPSMAGYMFDISSSYQSAFVACAVGAVIGLILAAALRPVESGIDKDID